MTDEELKRLVKVGMEAELEEAERILDIVNSDPVLKDIQAPPEIRQKLFAQIEEYEEQKRLANLTDEEKEWIRYGKIYKKRHKWNRVAVLIAAAVATVALGTVCIGEEKNILSIFKKMVAGEEMTEIDSDSIEPTVYIEEEELYKKIESEYGFVPIKLEYLPENTTFKEAVFCSDMQGINLYYESNQKANIIYIIRPNYRESSLSTVIEDEKIQEYKMIVNDVNITLTEYNIAETGENRWSILWVYQDVQYLLRITEMKQAEVEKLVNTLRFSE